MTQDEWNITLDWLLEYQNHAGMRWSDVECMVGKIDSKLSYEARDRITFAYRQRYNDRHMFGKGLLEYQKEALSDEQSI